MSPNPGRRAAQAEATRREIAGAARRLFAARGYAATTVRDIAREAGVSVQTVYDSVGSKRRLVEMLNDVIDEEAGIADIVGRALASGETAQLARLGPRVTRAILEHCGDIVRVGLTAAHSETELQRVRTEGHARHCAGTARVIAQLRARGALRDDRDDKELADVLAALTDTEFALILLDEYGWSLERVEEFVTDLVWRALDLS